MTIINNLNENLTEQEGLTPPVVSPFLVSSSHVNTSFEPVAGSGESEVTSTTNGDELLFEEHATFKLTDEAMNIQDYGTDTVHTLRLLHTKGLISESLIHSFTDRHVQLKFRTNNDTFMQVDRGQKNGGGTSETVYKWGSDLYSDIIPSKSTLRLNTSGVIEISLTKKVAGKWPQFSPNPQPFRVPPPPPAPPVVESTATNIKFKSRNTTLVRGQDEAGPSGVKGGQAPNCKPTASVSPYNLTASSSSVTQQGYTGLRNLGNTCFINATVQVLVNTRELREYFTNDYYCLDVNKVNPLGMKGQLAMAFAEFIQEMWNGNHCVYEPSTLRSLVSSKATQFANFAQHDAQEFLSFLLDGLHEDLNRVVNKPITERMESDGNIEDNLAAGETWKRHLLRDDSIIVDLFSGQLKSKLECLSCPKVSYTFDPFTYLTLPFPRKKKQLTFMFWPANIAEKPKRMAVTVPEDYTFKDIHQVVAAMVQVDAQNLISFEAFSHRVFQHFKDDSMIRSLQTNDVIHIAEVLDPEKIGEGVCNVIFLQRLNSKATLRSIVCAHCDTPPAGNECYLACQTCYDTLYCCEKCMAEDKAHQEYCSFKCCEKIGQPFFASLPMSKCDYENICSVVETRAKYSIKLFQPPVKSVSVAVGHASEEPMDTSNDGTDIDQNEHVDDPMHDEHKMPHVHADVTQLLPDQKQELFKLRWSEKDGETVTTHENYRRGEAISREDLRLDETEMNHLAVDWVIKQGNVDVLTVENRSDGGVFRMEYEDLCENVANQSDSTESFYNRRSEEHEIWDLLDRFTETEVLSNEEAWYCSSCKTNREAKKTLTLWKLPALLIVQLKRFIYSMSWAGRSKNDTRVKYPVQNFDLKHYVCQGADPQNTVYDLYGVVCHSGSSYFGHYISYGRLASLIDGEQTDVAWRKFDDSHVDDVTDDNDVVVDTAYLLFYKRRDAALPQWLQRYDVRKLDIASAKDSLYSNNESAEQEEKITLPDPEPEPEPEPDSTSCSTVTENTVQEINSDEDVSDNEAGNQLRQLYPSTSQNVNDETIPEDPEIGGLRQM